MKRVIDPITIQRNIDFFNEIHDRFPDSNHRSLHYNTAENQVTRFIVLTQIGELNESSILDYGCGLGDLSYLLDKWAPTCSYEGWDINPGYIQKARQKYPRHLFELIKPYQDSTWVKKFDWVLVGGVFNFNLGSEELIWDNLTTHIERLWSLCEKGLAFNLLTEVKHSPNICQHDVIKVYQFCKSLSSKVTLREDYFTHDATLYVYR
jgi:trans-aconitate methyltransferase